MVFDRKGYLKKAKQREKIIEEAGSRLEEELDILKILNKVRDNSQTLKSLISKGDRNVMKIAHMRVIDSDEPYEEDEPNNDGALSSDISVNLDLDVVGEDPPNEVELKLKEAISKALLRGAHLKSEEIMSLFYPIEVNESSPDFSNTNQSLINQH